MLQGSRSTTLNEILLLKEEGEKATQDEDTGIESFSSGGDSGGSAALR